MILKCIGFFIVFTYVIAISNASPAKDLILGRTYVVPADTPEETSNLLRLQSPRTSVQQILYTIFSPIQAIISLILTLICSLIPSVTALIETFRGTVLVSLIAVLDVIIPIASMLAPQTGAVLKVIELLLNAGNQLLYNGTTFIQDYGCCTILGINDVISNIVNVIVGVF